MRFTTAGPASTIRSTGMKKMIMTMVSCGLAADLFPRGRQAFVGQVRGEAAERGSKLATLKQRLLDGCREILTLIDSETLPKTIQRRVVGHARRRYPRCDGEDIRW